MRGIRQGRRRLQRGPSRHQHEGAGRRTPLTADDLVRFGIALNSGLPAPRRPRSNRCGRNRRPPTARESATASASASTPAQDGIRRMSHSGNQAGAASFLVMLPEVGVTYAIMTNLEDAELGTISRGIANAMRDAPDAGKEMSMRKLPADPAATLPAHAGGRSNPALAGRRGSSRLPHHAGGRAPHRWPHHAPRRDAVSRARAPGGRRADRGARRAAGFVERRTPPLLPAHSTSDGRWRRRRRPGSKARYVRPGPCACCDGARRVEVAHPMMIPFYRSLLRLFPATFREALPGMRCCALLPNVAGRARRAAGVWQRPLFRQRPRQGSSWVSAAAEAARPR